MLKSSDFIDKPIVVNALGVHKRVGTVVSAELDSSGFRFEGVITDEALVRYLQGQQEVSIGG